MLIGDDIAAALPELRAQAVSLMVDSCSIVRPGLPATDPVTGASVPTSTPVYTGACKVGGDRPYEQLPEGQGVTVTVQRFILHIPADGPRVQSGDVATITASQQPHLVGVVFRIAGPDERSWQTSQRVFVDRITAPQGV